MAEFKLEYQVGTVELQPANLLIADETDMDTVEYWENRMKYLKQDYAVVYRDYKGKVAYSIFANLREKGSAFRV